MSIENKLAHYTAQIAQLNHVVVGKDDPIMVLISVVGLLLDDLAKAHTELSNTSIANLENLLANYENSFIDKTQLLASSSITASVEYVLEKINEFIDDPKTSNFKELETKVDLLASEFKDLKKMNRIGNYVLFLTCFVIIASAVMFTVNAVFI